MPQLDLSLIDNHPDNANQMSDELLDKLAAHLTRTGRYPPLIVRQHPHDARRYQLLDGHHRAIALRRLGRTHASCDVWEVDDAEADLLLLTLNRLAGTDDPQQRGKLVQRAAARLGFERLAACLPDDVVRLKALVRTTKPPPEPIEPPNADEMPRAVTFFVSSSQRSRLIALLKHHGADRSAALVAMLNLDEEQESAGDRGDQGDAS